MLKTMRLVIVSGPLGVGKSTIARPTLQTSIDACVQHSDAYLHGFDELFRRGAGSLDYVDLYHQVRADECDAIFMDSLLSRLESGQDVSYESTGTSFPGWSLELADTYGYATELVYILAKRRTAWRRVKRRQQWMLDEYAHDKPAPRIVDHTTFQKIYDSSVRTCFEILTEPSSMDGFRNVRVYENEQEVRLLMESARPHAPMSSRSIRAQFAQYLTNMDW